MRYTLLPMVCLVSRVISLACIWLWRAYERKDYWALRLLRFYSTIGWLVFKGDLGKGGAEAFEGGFELAKSRLCGSGGAGAAYSYSSYMGDCCLGERIPIRFWIVLLISEFISNRRATSTYKGSLGLSCSFMSLLWPTGAEWVWFKWWSSKGLKSSDPENSKCSSRSFREEAFLNTCEFSFM